MKKRAFSKLLSLLLALVMLVGILPAGVISFAAVGDEFVYKFNQPSVTTKLENMKEYDRAKNPNWRFFDMSDSFKAIREDASYEELSKRVNIVAKNGFRFMREFEGKYTINDAWTAFKLSFEERGVYDLSFFGNQYDTVMNIYFAAYDEAIPDAAGYMTADNLILENAKYLSTPIEDIVIENTKKEYVMVFELVGKSETRTETMTFTKKEEMPYEIKVSNLSEVPGAPEGYQAVIIPSFELIGTHYANLKAGFLSGSDAFDMYFAEYKGGDASAYMNADTLVAENIEFDGGSALIADAFTVKSNVPHILILGEDVKTIEYDKTGDISYLYDLNGQKGSPHTAWLEYGTPHNNIKFFDLCDDFWNLRAGIAPSYAPDATASDIENVAKRIFNAGGFGDDYPYLRMYAGNERETPTLQVRDAWAGLRLKSPDARGIYDVNIEMSGGSYANNMSVWVAKYDPTKNDGADYMTDENLIIKEKSFATNQKPQGKGLVVDGSEELVIIFRINGKANQSNYEPHFGDLTLVKTDDLPAEYTAKITSAETEIESPVNYGIYELELRAKSGEDLLGVEAYVAPHGSANLTAEENKVAADASGRTYTGEKLFASLGGADKLSVYIDGYEKVDSIVIKKVHVPEIGMEFAPEKLTAEKAAEAIVTINGKRIVPWAVSIESSDENLVEGEGNGTLTVKKSGFATITATVGGKLFDQNISKSITTKIAAPDVEALPESISASFPSAFLEAERPGYLTVVDENGEEVAAGNIDVTYEIENEDVLEYNGISFVGKKAGSTDVIIRAAMGDDFREYVLHVIVVGKNLLTRVAANGVGAPVAHGSFETLPISKKVESYYPPVNGKSFWVLDHDYTLPKNLRTYEYDYSLVEGESPKFPGEKTNYLALDVDFEYVPDVWHTNLIRLKTHTRAFDWIYNGKPNEGHIGYPQGDKNKIYQLSAWFMVDENSTPESSVRMYMRYNNDKKNSFQEGPGDGSNRWTTDQIYVHEMSDTSKVKVKPGEWAYFETPPIATNWTDLQKTLEGGEEGVMWFEPYIDVSTSRTAKVRYYFSDVAIHEVAFDAVEFTHTGEFHKAKVYDTFKTKVTPLTSFGKEIKSGDTTKTFPVSYSTSNPRVAKINQSGVITAVSNGECEVYADVTIGGVTVRGVQTVSFSNLDVIFETVEGRITNDTLSSGDTAEISYEFFNTDGTPYIDTPESEDDNVRVFYESENSVIADVDQNGVVTAKAGGTTNIFVYAEHGKVLAKASIPVTVRDETPVASVKVSGMNIVERDFKIKLSATAKNESGSDTIIESVTFAAADAESEEIIEVSADGVVRGIAVGEAYVVATVKSTTGSEKTSEPFSITVVEQAPQNKIINFRTGPQGGGITKAYFDFYGYEVNVEHTDPHLIEDANATKPNDFRWLPEGLHAIPSQSGANTLKSDVAFNIKVDYDGWYLPKFTGTYHYNGPTRADLYFNDEYIGNYNFYSPIVTDTGDSKELNPVYLRKGTDNLFIIRISEGYRYLYLHSLELDYLGDAPELESVSLEIEKTTLAAGETSAVETLGKLTGGYDYEFGFLHGYKNNAENPHNSINPDAYVEYVSSDENVAKIVDGKLVAVGAGECTITSTAYYRGGEGVESKPVNITVTEETLGRIEVTPERVALLGGKNTKVTVKAFLTDGSEINAKDMTVAYRSNDTKVVNNDTYAYRIDAKSTGETTFTVTVTFNGQKLSYDIPVSVISSGFATVSLSAFSQVMAPGGDGYDIVLNCLDAKGALMDKTGVQVTYESSDESVVTVSESGFMTPHAVGTAEIKATVDLGGVVRVGTMTVSVRTGKTESTYYTKEKRENALNNIKKFDWARSTQKSAIKAADKYVEYAEYLYDLMPSEGIPRSFAAGFVDDPETFYCRYCGTNLMFKYDRYPWRIDALKTPWKVKCPSCARAFPSNDFGSFYELGRDEKGVFDLEYALNKHRQKFIKEIEAEYGEKYVTMDAPEEEYSDDWYKYYGYGVTGGYLTNNLYPEVGYETNSSFKGRFSKDENPKWWGVDNGWGYRPGRTYSNGVEEVHTYIAIFIHSGLWATTGASDSKFQPAIYKILTTCKTAYLYTGDKKYARAAAIVLDRIADLYPDFDLNPYRGKYQNSNQHAKSGGGKIIGNIWEASMLGPQWGPVYDAIFDIYEDPELLDILTQKAIKYNQTEKLVDGRVTPEKLRANVENNILGQMLPGVISGDITGNFGFFQNVLTKTAIVLDNSDITPEILKFVMQSGRDASGNSSNYSKATGGNIHAQIMNVVDRDGYGDESSLGYNAIWAERLLEIAQDLNDYAKIRPEYVEAEYNLLQNPKYIKMLQISYPTVVSGSISANIGDASDSGRRTPKDVAGGNKTLAMPGYIATRIPLFAQLLYQANGRTVEGLYTSIFDKDPEAIQKNLKVDIEKYGEIDYSKSHLLSGYGYSSLISGEQHLNAKAGTPGANTLRTFWMYFGGGQGHRHMDRLNLGIDFYGYDFAPEFGYPESVGGQDAAANKRWNMGTLSHNTVLVNEKIQSNVSRTGEADIRHFDADGDVKLMDVNAPLTYIGVTDIYRRTVVSIDIDDVATYAVDFFRVKGGNEHVYSFHSMSEEINFSDNLSFVKQPFGTYAGANIAFADNTAYTPLSGYNYLFNVRRAKNPGTGTFEADFKFKYLRIGQKSPDNLGMKLTMLNNWNITEVASAFGRPPQYGNNPLQYEYLLVKRTGEDLDTLFTSVIEPYENASKIASIERVESKRVDGKPIPESEPCEALKVTLASGRVDYVVYAANRDREYVICDGGNEVFRFKGFVGVYTLRNTGEVARVYLHDGVELDDGSRLEDGSTASHVITADKAVGAVKGTIKTFTKENNLETFIDLKTSADVPAESLVGKIINVTTNETQNGVYRIFGAEKIDGGYRISTGNVTLIRALKDPYDIHAGFIYNIKEGANFEIPLTENMTTAPSFGTADGKDEYTTSVGSTVKIPLKAESELGLPLTFDTSLLPRGAMFDEATQTISWKPTKTQVGENLVSITVSDGTFEKKLTFVVNVFGSTTAGAGSTSKDEANEGSNAGNAGNEGSGTASGGGGGGGTELPKPEDEPTDEPTDPVTPDVPEADGFRDLGNHAWAEDAINALAEEGIIKGTSEVTFAPASNITRADFAILLVRAFKLESENKENFADVAESDYFAGELAIARNTGIVGGIGDNKYAPRKTITRQDMMVIVYRVLEKLEIELEEGEVEYPDFDKLPDYAEDAVRALVANGLINGKNGLIDGNANTTRAEVAVLIKRIMDFAVKK